MSYRNATASWSGYAHQGKVGFLIALRRILTANFVELDQYVLELETQEDVKLEKNGETIEIHQVKAYTSGTTLSPYTEALEKFEGCEGQNYLHTICEITNWSTLDASKNPSGVLCYPYKTDQNYCSLDQIDNFILVEIKEILTKKGHSESSNVDWCRRAFQEYLALLDEKIRIEHQHGNQNTYRIAFKLDEILNLLTCPPKHRSALVCAIRREIYEQYISFIETLTEGGYPSMSPSHEQFIVEIISQICVLDDKQLEALLCRIFPASTQGKTLGTCTLSHDFFVANDFASTFLLTIISIEREKITFEGGTYPHYKVDYNYLVTAVQQPNALAHRIARQILDNDKLNTDRYETDFIINEHLSGKLHEKAKKVMDRKEGFMAEKEISFIKREEAVRILN